MIEICRVVSDIKYVHSLHMIGLVHAGMCLFSLRNLLIPSSTSHIPGIVFIIRRFIHLSVILHFHHLHVRATSLQINLLFLKFQFVEYFLCTQKSFLPTLSVHTCIHKHAILFPNFFFITLSERESTYRREMLKALHSYP